MGKWQPIETAPYDGTEVLISFPNGRVMISTQLKGRKIPAGTRAFGPVNYDFPTFMNIRPTHWMPLPDPPK